MSLKADSRRPATLSDEERPHATRFKPLLQVGDDVGLVLAADG
jgi:hypothetical protein